MKRFVLDPSFLELFPQSRIGVLVCKGIDNHVKEEERYAPWLRECEKLSSVYTGNPEFTENETIRNWRDAFYRFRTKKGARCSIEALLRRVSKGGEIGCINPLVDLYNGISLKYGMPVGRKDRSRIGRQRGKVYRRQDKSADRDRIKSKAIKRGRFSVPLMH